MARVRTQKYSKQEIKHASNKVMKSLNLINKRPLKFTPAISNSLAKSEVSKSAERRRKRRQKANLAGHTMDSLMDEIQEVENQIEQPPKHAGYIDPHKSQKNNKKVFDNEVNNYKKQVGLSLKEIRAQLQQ